MTPFVVEQAFVAPLLKHRTCHGVLPCYRAFTADGVRRSAQIVRTRAHERRQGACSFAGVDSQETVLLELGVERTPAHAEEPRGDRTIVERSLERIHQRLALGCAPVFTKRRNLCVGGVR